MEYLLIIGVIYVMYWYSKKTKGIDSNDSNNDSIEYTDYEELD